MLSLMSVVILKCGHCDTDNTVADCPKCGRSYVITTAHIEGRLRDYDAGPVSHLKAMILSTCDFCIHQILGDASAAASAGLRQRTCPVCRTEFLSLHGR